MSSWNFIAKMYGSPDAYSRRAHTVLQCVAAKQVAVEEWSVLCEQTDAYSRRVITCPL